MKVLHVASYYSGSSVYRKLFTSLDTGELEQCIYNAVRSEDLVGKNGIAFNHINSTIVYSNLLTFYTRLNFYAKIRRIYKDIDIKVDIKSIDVIHAHTWFSDGAVAYELNKKYSIPYIITIRNTDLNFFYKYMLHLRPYGMKILANADKVVFISPAYMMRLSKKMEPLIQAKSILIANGVDEYWHENVIEKAENKNSPFRILYVGGFAKGKNVEFLIKAVAKLRRSGLDIVLSIIGEGGSREKAIKKFDAENPWINFLGRINNKDLLRDEFRKCDVFAMPSRNETFGLVYIEALSQGLPIIYSRNEGIDGLHPTNIGEAVESSSINDIAKGLKKVYDNYSQYNFEIHNIINLHDWDRIADKYLEIYKELLNYEKK